MSPSKQKNTDDGLVMTSSTTRRTKPKSETAESKKISSSTGTPRRASAKKSAPSEPTPEVAAAPTTLSTQPAPSMPETKIYITHHDIERRAWEIWVREGCPSGRDMQHWLEAERELHS